MISRRCIDSLFIAWFIIVSIAGLSILFGPAFPWVMTVLFMTVLTFFLRKELLLTTVNFRLLYGVPIFYILFMINLGVVGFFYHQYQKLFVYQSKFFLMAILVFLLAKYKFSDGLLLKALCASVIINSLIILYSLYFGTSAGLFILGDGRIGSIFNQPGELWRVGYFLFIISFILYISSERIKYLFYFVMSTVLIALDGSRTAQLLIFIFFIAACFFNYYKNTRTNSKRLFFVFFIFLMTLLMTEGIRHKASQNANNLNVLSVTRLLNIEEMSSTSDISRWQMLTNASVRIQQAPLSFGQGIEAAKILTPTGYVVIHMVYFQVWLDYGVIGFLTYISIFLALAFSLFKLSYIKNEVLKSWIFQSSVCVFFSYFFMGLFHPLSNEVNYWAVFIIFLAYIIAMQHKLIENNE